MKQLANLSVALIVLLSLPGNASAQDNFTQDVTIVLEDINQLSVSAGTVSLTINTATAGSAPTDATDAATTYSITTNGTTKKLTGALDAAYSDAGLSLALLLAAPTGGSATERTLTAVAQDLVTGVSQIAQSGLTITYTASATVAATPNDPAGEMQTVTVTLTDV